MELQDSLVRKKMEPLREKHKKQLKETGSASGSYADIVYDKTRQKEEMYDELFGDDDKNEKSEPTMDDQKQVKQSGPSWSDRLADLIGKKIMEATQRKQMGQQKKPE